MRGGLVPKLGRIDTGLDLEEVQNRGTHLALLKHFWSTVLLTTGRYKGNPLRRTFACLLKKASEGVAIRPRSIQLRQAKRLSPEATDGFLSLLCFQRCTGSLSTGVLMTYTHSVVMDRPRHVLSCGYAINRDMIFS
jgi:hypothetical protein